MSGMSGSGVSGSGTELSPRGVYRVGNAWFAARISLKGGPASTSQAVGQQQVLDHASNMSLSSRTSPRELADSRSRTASLSNLNINMLGTTPRLSLENVSKHLNTVASTPRLSLDTIRKQHLQKPTSARLLGTPNAVSSESGAAVEKVFPGVARWKSDGGVERPMEIAVPRRHTFFQRPRVNIESSTKLPFDPTNQRPKETPSRACSSSNGEPQTGVVTNTTAPATASTGKNVSSGLSDREANDAQDSSTLHHMSEEHQINHGATSTSLAATSSSSRIPGPPPAAGSTTTLLPSPRESLLPLPPTTLRQTMLHTLQYWLEDLSSVGPVGQEGEGQVGTGTTEDHPAETVEPTSALDSVPRVSPPLTVKTLDAKRLSIMPPSQQGAASSTTSASTSVPVGAPGGGRGLSIEAAGENSSTDVYQTWRRTLTTQGESHSEEVAEHIRALLTLLSVDQEDSSQKREAPLLVSLPAVETLVARIRGEEHAVRAIHEANEDAERAESERLVLEATDRATQLHEDNLRLERELDRIKREIVLESDALAERVGLGRKEIHQSLLTGARFLMSADEMSTAQEAWRARIEEEHGKEREALLSEITRERDALLDEQAREREQIENEHQRSLEELGTSHAQEILAIQQKQGTDAAARIAEAEAIGRREVGRMLDEKRRLEGERDALVNSLQTKEGEHDALIEQIHQLQNALDAAIAQGSEVAEQLAQGKTEVERLTEQKKEFEEVQKTLEQEATELRDQIAEKDRENQEALEALAESRATEAQLRAATEQLRAVHSVIESKVAEMRTAQATSEKENEHLNQKIEQFRDEVSGLKKEGSRQQKHYEEARRDNQALRDQLASVSEQLEAGLWASMPSPRTGGGGASCAFAAARGNALASSPKDALMSQREKKLLLGPGRNGSPTSQLHLVPSPLASSNQGTFGSGGVAGMPTEQRMLERLRSVVRLLKSQLDSLRLDWQRTLESEQAERLKAAQAIARLQALQDNQNNPSSSSSSSCSLVEVVRGSGAISEQKGREQGQAHLSAVDDNAGASVRTTEDIQLDVAVPNIIETAQQQAQGIIDESKTLNENDGSLEDGGGVDEEHRNLNQEINRDDDPHQDSKKDLSCSLLRLVEDEQSRSAALQREVADLREKLLLSEIHRIDSHLQEKQVDVLQEQEKHRPIADSSATASSTGGLKPPESKTSTTTAEVASSSRPSTCGPSGTGPVERAQAAERSRLLEKKGKQHGAEVSPTAQHDTEKLAAAEAFSASLSARNKGNSTGCTSATSAYKQIAPRVYNTTSTTSTSGSGGTSASRGPGATANKLPGASSSSHSGAPASSGSSSGWAKPPTRSRGGTGTGNALMSSIVGGDQNHLGHHHKSMSRLLAEVEAEFFPHNHSLSMSGGLPLSLPGAAQPSVGQLLPATNDGRTLFPPRTDAHQELLLQQHLPQHTTSKIVPSKMSTLEEVFPQHHPNKMRSVDIARLRTQKYLRSDPAMSCEEDIALARMRMELRMAEMKSVQSAEEVLLRQSAHEQSWDQELSLIKAAKSILEQQVKAKNLNG
ncbi:unnamed protein product [Amoebophrya sp. A25]|nr:unnamed protein product [Amoebophrya sp. A25]|eukprot:GSA25T00006681001.1